MNPVVSDLLERGDENSMGALAHAARAEALSDNDIANLARGLAASGAQLPLDSQAADIASTGGPSSLSTLICPLHLRARGLKVSKLGVRGRPAGGVDVLETIPGFRARLDPVEAQDALAHSGYIHLLADERWAPLDARLFRFRQREGAQKAPPLVIASILAKKLAAGTMGAGLEIRVAPHGNFGDDREAARTNAHRFHRVARLLGLQSVCALTDASRPYQPYIGRGEALVALNEILESRAEGPLADHHALCLRMSDAMASAMGIATSHTPAPDQLREAHEAMLGAHGTDVRAFAERVEAIQAAPRWTVRSDAGGVVAYDLDRLRTLLVERQRAQPALPTGPPVDPAGVVLLALAGGAVEPGEPLVSIRVPEGERELAEKLSSCVRVDRELKIEAGAGDILEVI